MTRERLKIENIDKNPAIVISKTDAFGGFSCDKLAMLRKGRRYIIKLPDSFKDLISLYPERKFSKYSMDPACEWLGAQIFNSVKVPVQNVELCRYKGKIVAVCENFVQPHEMLLNFRDIYDTWSKDFIEPIVQQLAGQDAIGIEDIIRIVEDRYPNSEIKNFFWEMFVVDALTGNSDRNMSNWGVLINNDLTLSRIAPVYDNGSSFSKVWSDVYILQAMKDPSRLRETICNLNIPFLNNGNIITHNSYLNGSPSRDCTDAIIKIVPKIDIDLYFNDIDKLANSSVLSAIKADFYKQSLDWRYNDILKPALRQAELLNQGGPSI